MQGVIAVVGGAAAHAAFALLAAMPPSLQALMEADRPNLAAQRRQIAVGIGADHPGLRAMRLPSSRMRWPRQLSVRVISTESLRA